MRISHCSSHREQVLSRTISAPGTSLGILLPLEITPPANEQPDRTHCFTSVRRDLLLAKASTGRQSTEKITLILDFELDLTHAAPTELEAKTATAIYYWRRGLVAAGAKRKTEATGFADNY